MSAYMMNPEDHALLGAYLAHYCRDGIYNPVLRERVGDGMSNDDARAIFYGEVMAEANQASVNFRYRENEDCDVHVFEMVQLIPRIGGFKSHAEIYELACSLRYQSCEHPDWIEWHAYWMIEAILDQAGRHMARELNQDPEPEIPAAYVN